jgi:hypothetical protein
MDPVPVPVAEAPKPVLFWPPNIPPPVLPEPKPPAGVLFAVEPNPLKDEPDVAGLEAPKRELPVVEAPKGFEPKEVFVPLPKPPEKYR